MKYFISDLHFFHANILNMDGRNFDNITEMKDYIINVWNSRVKPNDEVFILGDFSWDNGTNTYDLLTKLRGKLYLIKGNHDYRYLEDKNFDDYIFEDVRDYMETRFEKKKIIMSHFPMPFYNHQFSDNCYMLYGHVHNTYDEYLLNRFINYSGKYERGTAGGEVQTTPFNMINVFCGFCGYIPRTIDEWIEIDKKRRSLINEFEETCGGFIEFSKWNEFNKIILSTFEGK